MNRNLKDVAGLFARLGITAFGGPAAHIAMMRHEVVGKHHWMDDKAFIDLMGATSLIPGPNSTEMAIHIGMEKAGWRGLLIAGILFILPAVIITGAIAWLYREYGSLPQVAPFIYGIKPAIVAIILMAVYPLAKASVKNMELAALGIAALVLSLAGVAEIAVIFAAGVLFMGYYYLRSGGMAGVFLPLLLIARHEAISNSGLFFTFLKIGSVLYGSGYVLFAFIDTELVATGILPRQVLIDAIAVGQFTPGPVFSSVTFIGYQVNGFWGAVVSTIGIFLPSFVFVALLNPLVHKVRGSKLLSAFLDAVNVASVAVIAAICWQMGQESIAGWRTAFLALAAFVLLAAFPRINSAFIVVFGSLAGYVLTLI